MKRVLIAAGVAGVALALTACGGASTATPAATPSTATASPSPSGSLVGGSPSTWSPMTFGPEINGTTVSMVPEEAAIFDGLPAVDSLNQIEVQSSDPSVVEVIQPTTGGSYEGGAGVVALKVGTAQITVINPAAPAEQGGASNVLLQFTVNVEPYQGDNGHSNDGTSMMTDSTAVVGSDPSTWSPVMVDKTAKNLSLLSGQHVVFPDYEYAKAPANTHYIVMTSNESVVAPSGAPDDQVPSFSAVAAGTAEVTLASYRGKAPTVKNTKVIQKVTVTVE